MIVFDVMFIFLIFYLFLYCIYQLFFFIKAASIEKHFEMIEKTRSVVLEKRKLCVIIWATYKDKNLDKLLNILNLQTYSKEHYEVHVIYQKDDNDPSNLRDFAYGAFIHNIQNPDYFSKDKAINLFVNKMLEEQDFDAYVFIGANRTIGEKYLENVNKSLTPSCVLVGSKICTNESNHFAKRIKHSIISAYLKYTNRTNDVVRSIFELPYFVDGENLVITSDIIQKMGYVEIEDKDCELEYTLHLASNDIKPIYCPYIISGIDVKNYNFESPSLSGRLSLFMHYFPHIFFKSLSFKEFIIFLLKPNSLVAVFGYILLLILSLTTSHVSVALVTSLGIFMGFNFISSIIISKLNIKEIFWLAFYPCCLGWQKLKILINSLTMRSILKSEYEEENVNSATINAIINNGKKDVHCKLDLVSEEGMRKVVFREGNRFIVTDSYLRMHDALVDITYKLHAKGMTLKICQNCQNFSISPDGTLDCLNGKCQIFNNEILVWNGCQYFYAGEKLKNNDN